MQVGATPAAAASKLPHSAQAKLQLNVKENPFKEISENIGHMMNSLEGANGVLLRRPQSEVELSTPNLLAIAATRNKSKRSHRKEDQHIDVGMANIKDRFTTDIAKYAGADTAEKGAEKLTQRLGEKRPQGEVTFKNPSNDEGASVLNAWDSQIQTPSAMGGA